jgi:Domain of unknown function (DUF4192)
MSKRSRTLKKARRDLASGQPMTKIRSAADALAVVPYLFGFTPQESIVVISLERSGRRFGPSVRLDLPADEDREAAADQVAWIVRRHGFTAVIVAAFSASPQVADPFVFGVLDRLRADDVRVVDAFRGDGQRWWSYVCEDPWCCPPDGSPYDADASPAAVDAVVAGMSKVADRDALREQFAPGDPETRTALSRAVDQLRQDQVPPLTPGQVDGLLPQVLDGADLDLRVEAHLMLSLTNLPQRDQVWGAMTRDTAAAHFHAWRRRMTLAPDGLLAPVGSLAAFAAWLSGKGVLASHAVDRVLELHPDYSMAMLVRRAIETAVDPRQWGSWLD